MWTIESLIRIFVCSVLNAWTFTSLDILYGLIIYTLRRKKSCGQVQKKNQNDQLQKIKSQFIEVKPSPKVPKGFNLLYKHATIWMKTIALCLVGMNRISLAQNGMGHSIQKIKILFGWPKEWNNPFFYSFQSID